MAQWAQWMRVASITIDQMQFSVDEYDLEFDVSGDNSEKANTTEIHIWNLSDETINRIQVGSVLTIDAGYQKEHGMIFAGTVAAMESEHQNADVKTIIQATNETQNLFASGLSPFTLSEGETLDHAIKKAFEMAAIPVGHIDPTGIKLAKPLTFHLTPKDILDRILKVLNSAITEVCPVPDPTPMLNTVGYIPKDVVQQRQQWLQNNLYTYYVDGGAGYFVRGDYTTRDVIVVEENSGLLSISPIMQDQPTGDETSGGQAGAYRIKTLLNWRVKAGTYLKISSSRYTGYGAVVKYSHSCNGSSFFTEMEVKKV